MDHAKYWFRHRRIRIEITAISLFLSCIVALPVAGQPDPGDAAALPPALRNFLEGVDSYRARFVQELWSDDQRLIEVAEGEVELLRPDRFRWHYDAPWEQLIVADGQTLWMYDVDISQVTRSSLQEGGAGNPGTLLSGDSDVMENFLVTGSGTDDDDIWVSLAPRSQRSDYVSVRVTFSGADSDNVLSELEFVDGLSQTTVIRFLEAEVNPNLSPDRFEFEVPADAHVLGGPG